MSSRNRREAWGIFHGQKTAFEAGWRLQIMKRSLFAAAFLAVTALMAASPAPLSDIPLKDIDGNPTSLKPYAGKVLLVVNVASFCGNTPQYAGLESLYEKYKDRGLVVLGFPCNDFGAQEPGSNAEVKEFCTSKYKVTFPMFDKLHVKGAEQHPLYSALTGKTGAFPGDVKWNFGKFLIGKDGKPLKRFEPPVKPTDPTLVKSIEDALAEK
jgi:glutathione peroxidase